jgi:ribonuclease HII
VLYYERKLRARGVKLIIGVDEAGRGPLAGPVVAAAVALEATRFQCRIDDSKKLTSSAREKAFLEIIKKSLFGIGIVNERVIDRVNIAVATRIAMEEAISSLLDKIHKGKSMRMHVIVDGNMPLDAGLPHTTIIKGDAKSKSIAAASILAKVTRDRIMDMYDQVFPQYGFKQHKGYPTRLHRSLINKFGLTVIHRKSFIS